jgi:hypothetical protein
MVEGDSRALSPELALRHSKVNVRGPKMAARTGAIVQA